MRPHPRTVASILDVAATVVPGRVAITLGDCQRTFADMQQAAYRTAQALRGAGSGPGDVVAFWGSVSLRQVEVFAAAARIGAPFAPLSPAATPEELRSALSYLAPRMLVTSSDFLEAAEALAVDMGLALVVVGHAGPGALPGHDLDRLTAAARPELASGSGPGEADLHAIYLTSGSTGRPKGVALSHRASWLRSYPGRSPTTARGHVNMFPLSHWAGWQMITESWQQRRPVHQVAAADAAQLLDALDRWSAASLYCIPAVWERVLDHMPPGFDTSRLRAADTGTSFVSAELISRLRERFPQAAITASYGSTEAGGSAVLGDEDVERKHGTVGQPCHGMAARVDVDGELLIRSSYMMDGYYRLEDETAAVLDGDWYRTGDVGTIDADGYLTISGRKRETIRSGGETIAPVEVEQAARSYPGIKDVAVVGIPDDRWGEIVCAVVVMDGGCPPPSIDALRDHVRPFLAPPKHPRLVLLAEDLARTGATGQLRRSLIRDAAIASLRPNVVDPA